MRFHLPRLRPITFGPLHVLLPMVALLVALFGYAALQTAAQNYHLAEERRVVEAEIHALRTRQAELEGLREYLLSDEYVEAVARSRFGLAYPGETVVLVDAPPSEEPGREPGERWWEVLFDR